MSGKKPSWASSRERSNFPAKKLKTKDYRLQAKQAGVLQQPSVCDVCRISGQITKAMELLAFRVHPTAGQQVSTKTLSKVKGEKQNTRKDYMKTVHRSFQWGRKQKVNGSG